MAAESSAKLLLIVTGSTLRAEEVDRPLAYYLKQQVEQHLAEHDIYAFQVLVVADFLWLNDEPLQDLPTLSVGGPGVNALAHRWWNDELPLSLEVEDQYYIQMDPDLEISRASIWGMDNATTQIAVAVFISRFLPRFLERCAAQTPNSPDLDDTD